MNRELPPIMFFAALYFPPGPDGVLREMGFRHDLTSWNRNLWYRGDLHLIVVNDGPALAPFPEWSGPQEALGHERNGMGASWNQALHKAWETSPLVGYVDDDWELIRPLVLTPWAKMLMEDETIGAVHLSAPYPGCTGTIEPRKHGWIIRLNRHNLAAGLRACLYHKRYFDAYGYFDEGISAWEAERLHNERFCQSSGPDSVLALPLPWQEGPGAVVELGDKNPGTYHA